MFDSLVIDGRSKHTASEQIYFYVIDGILNLNIDSQTVFPMSHEVAASSHITTADVEKAYSRLVAESYCEVQGNTITLIDAELRRSIQISSMSDVLTIASTMNMEATSQSFEPIVSSLPPELILLSKRSMPKQSLLLRTLNVGDGIPLSYVLIVINKKKLPKELLSMATDMSFYDALSNHPDSLVHPTLMSACRLTPDVSALMQLPNNIPALCMHSTIDFLTKTNVAQMYVLLTPRVFLSLNT